MRGTSPLVDTVILLAPNPIPHGAFRIPMACIRFGIVCKWLAHSHEDNVVYLFFGEFFHGQKLCDNLAGCEIALQTVETARAEFAPVGASDLA